MSGEIPTGLFSATREKQKINPTAAMIAAFSYPSSPSEQVDVRNDTRIQFQTGSFLFQESVSDQKYLFLRRIHLVHT